MKPAMPNLIILIALSAMLCLRVQAATPEEQLVIQAYNLKIRGDMRGAIAILEPIARSTDAALSEDKKGVVWNILGSSYQDLDMFEKARDCYEHAIVLLREAEPHTAQYASTLDNLGSVEMSLGEMNDSARLRKKARRIYATLGDHPGVARVSTNLAVLALLTNHGASAQRNLNSALHEFQKAGTADDDDIAGVRSVQGWLYLKKGNSAAALSSFQEAIDHWTRLHGSASYQTAWGLCMRAQAYKQSGDVDQASSDLRRALGIFTITPGKTSTIYWTTALQLAQVMRLQGNASEARSLESKAVTALDNIKAHSCRGCSVTVEALR